MSQPLVDGREVPTPSPGAVASGPPNDIKPDRRPIGPNLGTPASTGSGAAPIIAAIIGLLVVTVGAALLVLRVRAGRRREIGVADAYRGVVGVASRLGYGPRPSQTIYEYADSLGRLVPVARADLLTVADARVETAYGHRKLGSDRLAAVVAAARRLRLSLLRLFFRRGPRGRTRVVRPPRR